jgi:hypothetical protein
MGERTAKSGWQRVWVPTARQGVVSRVYAARGNRPTRYLVKWDEGTSTSIEEAHLTLIGSSEATTTNTDEETTGLSDHLTRDGESTDDERDEEEGEEAARPLEGDAVIIPIGGHVLCGEYRWRRVKAISSDPRAAHPEFDFSTCQRASRKIRPCMTSYGCACQCPVQHYSQPSVHVQVARIPAPALNQQV